MSATLVMTISKKPGSARQFSGRQYTRDPDDFLAAAGETVIQPQQSDDFKWQECPARPGSPCLDHIYRETFAEFGSLIPQRALASLVV